MGGRLCVPDWMNGFVDAEPWAAGVALTVLPSPGIWLLVRSRGRSRR